ncbi:MAG: hypothetical protein IKB93_00195 [Clostridia bacterium]|nr:hypothetical protein [Clostridia bacterium]
MISCTEFIPLYSEFFKFLEKKGGHDEVLKYWNHISDTSIGDKTNKNSLAYKCEKSGGFEGAVAYWGHTLTEEACDLFEIINTNKKYFYSHMRHCPSRGMLNSLKHIEPYFDYCSHCNVIYQRVLDNYDIVYERDNSKVDNAECFSLLYEKGNRPDFDFANLTPEQIEELKSDNNCKVIDMKSEDNKYLHRDFHLLGDNALKYCGETFGDEAVIDFLTTYTKNYYSPIIDEIKKHGLIRLKEWIEKIYEIEEASKLLHFEISDDALIVTIDKSPVIEYMYSLNQEPSKYYIEETKTLYKTIAEECNLDFELDYYKDNGEAKFTFKKK